MFLRLCDFPNKASAIEKQTCNSCDHVNITSSVALSIHQGKVFEGQ